MSLARFRDSGGLVYGSEDDVFEVMYLDGLEIDYCVTHWMSLPPAPKE